MSDLYFSAGADIVFVRINFTFQTKPTDTYPSAAIANALLPARGWIHHLHYLQHRPDLALLLLRFQSPESTR